MNLRDFLLTRHVPNATDATNQLILTAPFDLQIVGIIARHRVASTSGTLDLKKAASATALSAGSSLLTAVMSLAGAADTNLAGSLITAINGLIVPKGQSVGLVFGGTLTNLADLDVTVQLRQMRLP